MEVSQQRRSFLGRNLLSTKLCLPQVYSRDIQIRVIHCSQKNNSIILNPHTADPRCNTNSFPLMLNTRLETMVLKGIST